MKHFLLLVALTGFAVAQEPAAKPAAESGWRKAGDAAPPAAAAPELRPVVLPGQVVLPAGTMIQVRVNEFLSSDRSHAGDQFTATLAQPVIGEGFVLARRGQLLSGRVAEAVKAGRVKGTSRLAIELNEMTTAGGAQVKILTQLMNYSSGTSKGRDATAVGTGTGLGAMIGAAADGGTGAGAGAAAGAVASTIGVLLTRGRATEVDNEAILTFRLAAAATVDTDRSPHAFLQVRQDDYDNRTQNRAPSLQRRNSGVWGYPGFWYGPSVFYGRGWGGPGFYGRRGWGGGGWGGPGWGGPGGWWW